MKLLLAFTLIFPAAATSALAADPQLKGTFVFNEDKTIGFYVVGDAAKALFDNMPVKAVKEECTGGMEKSDKSGLNCIKNDDGTYNCDFGYDFKKRAFSGSGQDC